jgi:hypothetical protein
LNHPFHLQENAIARELRLIALKLFQEELGSRVFPSLSNLADISIFSKSSAFESPKLCFLHLSNSEDKQFNQMCEPRDLRNIVDIPLAIIIQQIRLTIVHSDRIIVFFKHPRIPGRLACLMEKSGKGSSSDFFG